jgi:cyanophycinase
VSPNLSLRFSLLHSVHAGTLVAGCCWCLAALGEETAGFPWIDPQGVDQPVLLCANSPPQRVLEEFEKTVPGGPKHIVIQQCGSGISTLESNTLPKTLLCFGELKEVDRLSLIALQAERPDQLALALAPDSVLLVHGRRMQVLTGTVSVLLAASAGRPLLEIELKAGQRHDWTMLRRAAMERSRGEFPPIVLPLPQVAAGTLLIHGGGEMPKDVTDKFIELAGGVDASIVVLPIAADESLPEDESRDTRVWTRAGAKNVRSLRARTRAEVESPEFASAIQNAKAVWFGGGRQWRFVDAYIGTKAEELFRGVLTRGGVIGGSSAGASIQGQYMPRGSPLGNTDMMAEGYERGLDFLPGTAVDQHFTQRKRQRDMTALMRRNPQVLGIGLDEGTAIVVQGSKAQVIGRGGAHFYDYRTGTPAGELDFTLVTAGGQYDLAARRPRGHETQRRAPKRSAPTLKAWEAE